MRYNSKNQQAQHISARENAVEEVIADLVASAQQLIQSLHALPEQQLIGTIAVADSTQSLYEYIVHVVNHGSYHHGQIVTLCRALGVTEEMPVTDYDSTFGGLRICDFLAV